MAVQNESSVFKNDLKRADDRLKEQVLSGSRTAEVDGYSFHSGLKSWSMTPENSLESLDRVVNGSRIRKLKAVWTLDTGSKCSMRLQAIAVFLRIKALLRPEICSFQDPKTTDQEKAHLNAIGVATPPFEDFLEEKIEEAEEGVLDVYYMVLCNMVVINNFIAGNWKESTLKHVVLIHDFDVFGICAAVSPALRAIMAYPKSDNLMCLPSNWYYWNPREITAQRLQFYPLPTTPTLKVDARWNFVPSFMKASSRGLIEATTFDQISSNIEALQTQLADDGLLSKFMQNLSAILEGRELRRIRMVGTGYFANKFNYARNNTRSLHQLALALSFRKAFNVNQISFQDPCSTQFERDYLRSIGIEVLPPDDCSNTEEGLNTNEVALIMSPGTGGDLLNNQIWANRKQMRKILLFASTDTIKRPNRSRGETAIIAFLRNYRIIETISDTFIDAELGKSHPLARLAIASHNTDVVNGVSDQKPEKDEVGDVLYRLLYSTESRLNEEEYLRRSRHLNSEKL